MLFFLLFNFSFLLVIGNASHLAHLKSLLKATRIEVPKIDLSSNRNHAMELLGDFKDLTFYRYRGQDNFTRPLSAWDSSHGLIYYSNDTFLKLADASDNTDIRQITPLGADSFILSGSGNIEGYDLRRHLQYNLTDLSLKPIFQKALNGVNSILVNESFVYFGGNFSFFNGSKAGHSVVLWDSEKNCTSLLPFVGFGEDSKINSIVQLDSDNILFAGEFYELDDVKLLEANMHNVARRKNWTDVELGLVIPLQDANWTYSSSQFDINGFTCPNSSRESWSQSGTSGSLSCSLPQGTSPYKIRIYNSPIEDNEVSLFRILSYPGRGIMNLSYVDPDAGVLKYCDAFCPLYNRQRLERASSNSSSAKHMTTFLDDNTTDIKWSRDFQEFAFVDQVSISAVDFLALSSYGNNVGLSSLQLLQSTRSIYANNSLNKPACGNMVSYSGANLSNSGWKQGLAGHTYLSTRYVENQGEAPSVTFYPNIEYPGNYSIKLYTPGCREDGTCDERAMVNVTLWKSDSGQTLSSGLIYENNDDLKYNELWNGHLDSSPRVTLQYYSPIYPNNPTSVMVADHITLETKSIEEFSHHKERIMLNGLFQYQMSNFTGKTPSNSVGDKPLDEFALSHFPKNSSLFAALYGKDTLLVADSKSKVSEVKLGKNWSTGSCDSFKTSANIRGIGSYSQGLVLFGDYSPPQKESLALSFNGSFSSHVRMNQTIDLFTNITLKGSELLIFDNTFFYNPSSGNSVSNTTKFSLSVWSAAQNIYGDLVFSGAISENDYQNLRGPVNIFSNGSIISSNTNGGVSPYIATYLNNSLTAYGYKDGSNSSLIFSNGEKGSWKWANSIQTMTYFNKDRMLAVATSSLPSLPQLSILNLTTSKELANEFLNEGEEVNTMVLFGRNSTLLVGGNFTIANADCGGLCLYNYKEKKWSAFGNGSITGHITQIQLRNSSELLIAGSMKVKGTSNVNLISMNISGQRIKTLLNGWENPLRSFLITQGGGRLIAWNDTSLMVYDNNSWKHISVSDSTDIPKLLDIQPLSLEQTHRKRASSSSNSDLNGLLVYGEARGQKNSYQASIYDYHKWTPLLIDNPQENSNPDVKLFMDQDVSDFSITEQILQNPVKHKSSISSLSSTDSRTRSSLVPTSSSTKTFVSTRTSSSTNKDHHHSHKVDRGYVVLIGLALAVGTVIAIGIVGILIAFFFGDGIWGYDFLGPPTGDANSVESIPLEKKQKPF